MSSCSLGSEVRGEWPSCLDITNKVCRKVSFMYNMTNLEADWLQQWKTTLSATGCQL